MTIDFAALPLSPALLAIVQELGFEKPTPIQAQTIPILIANQDLVGQSQTGSGKTAAFALPMLQKLVVEQRELGALVLCPTRELSAQVAREIRKLGRRLPGLAVVVLAGGEPVRKQALALERGAHIAVGTPGRVLDQLQRRNLRVHRVSMVVLDEADRMLEMGFLDDVDAILKALPPARQTVFFSATFPSDIKELSRRQQKNPVFVNIEDEEQAKPNIEARVIEVDGNDKLQALRWVLEHHPHESALVFANQKVTVAEIEKALTKAGVSVDCLHGDLEQYDRDRVMAKFRNASTRVLIATDVAARGLDIENLDLVVNYDVPRQPEVYLHRIGRTGRAGRAGLAVTLCTSREQEQLMEIERFTGTTLLNTGPKHDAAPAKGAGNTLRREAKMETLRISGGRKDKLRAGDILGALTGEAGGLLAEEIGKIEIHDNFAYVAVAKTVSRRAQQSLSSGRIKGRKFQVTLVE